MIGQKTTYAIQSISQQAPGTSYTKTWIPITPSVATTIHKAQIDTIDGVVVHWDNIPIRGQIYVTIYQVRKAENMHFFGADPPISIKLKCEVDGDAIKTVWKFSKKNCNINFYILLLVEQ